MKMQLADGMLMGEGILTRSSVYTLTIGVYPRLRPQQEVRVSQ